MMWIKHRKVSKKNTIKINEVMFEVTFGIMGISATTISITQYEIKQMQKNNNINK